MKKFLFFIAAAIVAAGCATQSTTDKPELRFREDGTFKIAQYTDLHWEEEDPEGVEVIKNIIRDVVVYRHPLIFLIIRSKMLYGTRHGTLCHTTKLSCCHLTCKKRVLTKILKVSSV